MTCEAPKLEQAAVQAPPPVALTIIPVRFVDGRQPFATLAIYQLNVVPRPGDQILINVSGTTQNFRAEFVSFNPFDVVAQVTIGCSLVSSPNVGAAAGPDLEKQMDQIVKAQTTAYEKAQAYSNAITVAGYAGLFAIWSFLKPELTPFGSSIVAALSSISLLLYISWEIVGMLDRGAVSARFLKLVDEDPAEFFSHIQIFEKENRQSAMKYLVYWRIVFIPTVATAYGAALILLYGAIANIFGLPKWP